MTLRVGVTGHRWNKIRREAAVEVAHALSSVFEEIDRKHGDITLVNGMAEGSDLIAAATRPKDWNLEPVLALPVPLWRKHLRCQPGDLALFDRLISAAVAPICPPQGVGPNFDFVAERIAESSDILVAVWNGLPGEAGGTLDVIDRAKTLMTPVKIVWQESWSYAAS